MGLGSKIVATLVILGGTIVFTDLIFLNPAFRSTFWLLVNGNFLYASVGIIAVYASIIALANWLWNR
jgi:hypothetical protein